MRTLLIWGARLLALAGVALITVAVVTRFRGAYQVASFDVATFLFGGLVAMVAACLAYVSALVEFGRTA
jgi:hypothetical protein